MTTRGDIDLTPAGRPLAPPVRLAVASARGAPRGKRSARVDSALANPIEADGSQQVRAERKGGVCEGDSEDGIIQGATCEWCTGDRGQTTVPQGDAVAGAPHR